MTALSDLFGRAPVSLRPFWRYYGGKWQAAPSYAPPRHRLIIEPFAGAAGYSTRHAHHDVLLLDVSPIIVGIWSWLISASPADILDIPDVPEGGTVDDLNAPQPARWLAGFWCNNGVASPRKRPSLWAMRPHKLEGWSASVRRRLAAQVPHIRHWTAQHGTYRDAPDERATWFIDPPYQGRAGSHYPHGSKGIDYADLGAWCEERRGQVIVCEAEGADWLPFMPHKALRYTHHANRTKPPPDVIWSRHV